jgi:serine/threonine protein kinase
VLSLSAAYLALLHRRGVWHRDMKCSNLVVVGHADRVLLCDLEDTSLRLNVSDRMVVRSLVQFLAYVPSSVPPCQRIRFFAVYARETGMSRASFRRLYGLLKRVGGERVWNGS